MRSFEPVSISWSSPLPTDTTPRPRSPPWNATSACSARSRWRSTCPTPAGSARRPRAPAPSTSSRTTAAMPRSTGASRRSCAKGSGPSWRASRCTRGTSAPRPGSRIAPSRAGFSTRTWFTSSISWSGWWRRSPRCSVSRAGLCTRISMTSSSRSPSRAAPSARSRPRATRRGSTPPNAPSWSATMPWSSSRGWTASCTRRVRVRRSASTTAPVSPGKSAGGTWSRTPRWSRRISPAGGPASPRRAPCDRSRSQRPVRRRPATPAPCGPDPLPPTEPTRTVVTPSGRARRGNGGLGAEQRLAQVDDRTQLATRAQGAARGHRHVHLAQAHGDVAGHVGEEVRQGCPDGPLHLVLRSPLAKLHLDLDHIAQIGTRHQDLPVVRQAAHVLEDSFEHPRADVPQTAVDHLVAAADDLGDAPQSLQIAVADALHEAGHVRGPVPQERHDPAGQRGEDDLALPLIVRLRDLEPELQLLEVVAVLAGALRPCAAERLGLAVGQEQVGLPDLFHVPPGLFGHVLAPDQHQLHRPGPALFCDLGEAHDPRGLDDHHVEAIVDRTVVEFRRGNLARFDEKTTERLRRRPQGRSRVPERQVEGRNHAILRADPQRPEPGRPIAAHVSHLGEREEYLLASRGERPGGLESELRPIAEKVLDGMGQEVR